MYLILVYPFRIHYYLMSFAVKVLLTILKPKSSNGLCLIKMSRISLMILFLYLSKKTMQSNVAVSSISNFEPSNCLII